MPKGVEARHLAPPPKQLLETLHIANGPKVSGQRIRRGEPKANLQHVEQSFNGAFSASLLNAFVDTV